MNNSDKLEPDSNKVDMYHRYSKSGYKRGKDESAFMNMIYGALVFFGLLVLMSIESHFIV